MRASRSSVSRIVTGSPLQTSTTVPGGVDSRAAHRNASTTSSTKTQSTRRRPLLTGGSSPREERRGDGGDQLRPVRLSGAVDHGDPQDAHRQVPEAREHRRVRRGRQLRRGVGRGRRRLVTAEVLLDRAGEDDPRGGGRLRHRGEQVDREPLVGAHHRDDEVDATGAAHHARQVEHDLRLDGGDEGETGVGVAEVDHVGAFDGHRTADGQMRLGVQRGEPGHDARPDEAGTPGDEDPAAGPVAVTVAHPTSFAERMPLRGGMREARARWLPSPCRGRSPSPAVASTAHRAGPRPRRPRRRHRRPAG